MNKRSTPNQERTRRPPPIEPGDYQAELRRLLTLRKTQHRPLRIWWLTLFPVLIGEFVLAYSLSARFGDTEARVLAVLLVLPVLYVVAIYVAGTVAAFGEYALQRWIDEDQGGRTGSSNSRETTPEG